MQKQGLERHETERPRQQRRPTLTRRGRPDSRTELATCPHNPVSTPFPILTFLAFRQKMLYICNSEEGCPEGRPSILWYFRCFSDERMINSVLKNITCRLNSKYWSWNCNTDFLIFCTEGSVFDYLKSYRRLKMLMSGGLFCLFSAFSHKKN